MPFFYPFLKRVSKYLLCRRLEHLHVYSFRGVGKHWWRHRRPTSNAITFLFTLPLSALKSCFLFTNYYNGVFKDDFHVFWPDWSHAYHLIPSPFFFFRSVKGWGYGSEHKRHLLHETKYKSQPVPEREIVKVWNSSCFRWLHLIIFHD